MLAIMKVMGIDKIVGDSLTGELALVVYQFDNLSGIPSGNVVPGDFDVALMFGLKDDAYLEKMSATYGPELGLLPAVQKGEWKVLATQNEPSIGIFYNNELLVVTPDLLDVMSNVGTATDDALNVAPCQLYLDIDLSRIDSELVGPVSGMVAENHGSDADFAKYLSSVSYLLNKPAADSLGSINFSTSHVAGSGQHAQFSLTKPALRYAAFHLLAGLGALASNEDWFEQLGIVEMLEELPEAFGEDEAEMTQTSNVE
jgi:hypothetical protein